MCASCLVHGSRNMKDFLERVWDYQTKTKSIPCTGFFFALGFSRLERGLDPETLWSLSPESDDCELASESIYTLWANIFNSRYFSNAYSKWNLWQNKGILDDKGRIHLFFRLLCHFSIFVLEWVTLRSWSRNFVTFCSSRTFFVDKILFQKSCYHWTATLSVIIACKLQQWKFKFDFPHNIGSSCSFPQYCSNFDLQNCIKQNIVVLTCLYNCQIGRKVTTSFTLY